MSGGVAPAGAGLGESRFWALVRRRRNLFFVVGVGWLVAGLPLWAVFRALLPGTDPLAAGVIALLTWGMLWWWTAQRLTEMRCFSCGNRAFTNPLFRMRNARCQVCGTRCRGA